MEILNLFPVPVYKFKYNDHDVLKLKAMEYLGNDEAFALNSRKGTGLDFTTPNLHRHPTFKDFANWVHNNTASVMIDLGFHGSLQITALWGTRHRNQVGHHVHQHCNSFLAGVYYLNGSNKNSGTTFYNVDDNHLRMVPGRIPGRPLKIRNEVTMPFEEGTLLIFPSWLKHRVAPNILSETESVRYVLAFNSMPVGMTNSDEFDRYNYQDISSAELQDLPQPSNSTKE